MNPLPVSLPVIFNELETAIAILKKWQDTVNVLTTQSEEMPTGLGGASLGDQAVRELVYELQIVSGKCEVLSDALNSYFQ